MDDFLDSSLLALMERMEASNDSISICSVVIDDDLDEDAGGVGKVEGERTVGELALDGVDTTGGELRVGIATSLSASGALTTAGLGTVGLGR